MTSCDQFFAGVSLLVRKSSIRRTHKDKRGERETMREREKGLGE